MRSTLSTPFCKVMRRVSGPISGRACVGRLLGVPQLDREQHDVDRADRGRIVGDIRLRQMQVAVHAFDLQPVLRDGVAMGAARDEEHVVPGRRHARAEITADRARRHRRNPHRLAPSEWGQGIARK